MKKLVVKGSIPKSISGCIVNDFEEELAMYLQKANKRWKTAEGFSLEYDSLLSDLRESHFIYVDQIELEQLIKRRLNVIEEIEL